METNTEPERSARTRGEAIERATFVSYSSLYEKLAEDDNPRIYVYRRVARIAIRADANIRFGYVGFDYCDFDGFHRTDGIAWMQGVFSSGLRYRPPVFEFEDAKGEFTYLCGINPDDKLQVQF